MKILFLHESNLEESLGIANLSAMLRSQEHICDVLIQSAEGRHFFDKVMAFNPSIIAFSCATGRHVWANRIAGEIKRLVNCIAIIGGPHATIYREEAIREKNIDIICVGEGEYPLLELADRLGKKQDITNIKNLWVKIGTSIYRNELRSLNDINALPYPDRSLYYRYLYNRNVTAKRFISSIGCPFICSFCQNPLFNELYKNKGPIIRRKDVDRVIHEINYIKIRYPLKLVSFSDDIFATDKAWLEVFSRQYKQMVGLPFNCNIRLSCLDEDVVKLLKEAGCHAVTFGLESGNETLRNKILMKNTPEEDIVKKVSLLKKYGIEVLTTNMIALPQESIRNAYETIRLNRKIKADYMRIFITKPYQGTELFEYGKRNHLLAKEVFDSKNYETLDTIYFKTDHEKEFRNLRCLFYLIVKWPFLEKISYTLIKLPFMKVYKLLFFITEVTQEKRFFKISLSRNLLLGLRLIKGFGKHY